jgi:membrane-associated phospholipid phosphatase
MAQRKKAQIENVMPSSQREYGTRSRGLLRSPGILAKWPIIGLIMVLAGGIAFGAIAYSVETNSPLIQYDVPVSMAAHQAALQSSPALRQFMIAGFYVGEQVIVAIGAILFLYFFVMRLWPELLMVLIAWAGEGAIWIYTSAFFDRHRPVFDTPVWHQMTSPGFPSGHSISAVMCYGLIAYLLMPSVRSVIAKAFVIALAVLVILYVGYSRIFVGDHYLSDVLAGFALGIAWSGLVYTLVELAFFKRNKRHV